MLFLSILIILAAAVKCQELSQDSSSLFSLTSPLEDSSSFSAVDGDEFEDVAYDIDEQATPALANAAVDPSTFADSSISADSSNFIGLGLGIKKHILGKKVKGKRKRRKQKTTTTTTTTIIRGGQSRGGYPYQQQPQRLPDYDDGCAICREQRGGRDRVQVIETGETRSSSSRSRERDDRQVVPIGSSGRGRSRDYDEGNRVDRDEETNVRIERTYSATSTFYSSSPTPTPTPSDTVSSTSTSSSTSTADATTTSATMVVSKAMPIQLSSFVLFLCSSLVI